MKRRQRIRQALIALAFLASSTPIAAAVNSDEPILSHSALDDLENHIGLLGLLGLLGLFGFRGRDRRH